MRHAFLEKGSRVMGQPLVVSIFGGYRTESGFRFSYEDHQKHTALGDEALPCMKKVCKGERDAYMNGLRVNVCLGFKSQWATLFGQQSQLLIDSSPLKMECLRKVITSTHPSIRGSLQ